MKTDQKKASAAGATANRGKSSLGRLERTEGSKANVLPVSMVRLHVTSRGRSIQAGRAFA